MPHYADGTPCNIGDMVTAKLFNTDHPVAGTVVSITPGADACNVKVRFVEAVFVVADDANGTLPRPRMAVGEPHIAKSEQHGSAGHLIALYDCEDYCDTNKLTKIA